MDMDVSWIWYLLAALSMLFSFYHGYNTGVKA